MLKNLWLAAQFLLLEISLAGPLQAATLKAGVAKVDITPPTGQPMYGYGSRKSPSTSTLDPLYARVLVLDVNGRRLALVTLDLGRVFGPSSLERVKRVPSRCRQSRCLFQHGQSQQVLLRDRCEPPHPQWSLRLAS
jgi:hypothetical protein